MNIRPQLHLCYDECFCKVFVDLQEDECLRHHFPEIKNKGKDQLIGKLFLKVATVIFGSSSLQELK